MKPPPFRAAFFGLSVCLAGNLAAADWPQWRGPDRTNVSKETGLAAEWPKDGPPLAWKAIGLGEGVAPVSVAGGRVFTTGNVDGEVVCFALAEKDGKERWKAKLGPAAKESSLMRWLAQAAPTVDDERVYVVTSNGDYVCLAADTGKTMWRKHFVKDFEGKKGVWGYCDYPLVDGENLILTPGGAKNTMLAVNRKTGDTVWSCSLPGGDTAAHSVVVAAEITGVRQYINHLGRLMIGVSAKDGKLLWSTDTFQTRIAATHSPIIRDNTVFYASGYGVGHALLKIEKTGGAWTVEDVYRMRTAQYVPWLGSSTRFGEQVLVTNSTGLISLDWKTGEAKWDARIGRCMYTIADEKLFIRTQKGQLILATAEMSGCRKISEFTPHTDQGQPAWTYPVVSNGRMYIRDYESLYAYDVRDPERPHKRAPDAVFVPTPPDVVKRMLELAGVKKDDIVFDLGSGDGRIVIDAATRHGCKAVGVEIDGELVARSRERAKEAGVEKLATFEHADLFEADFSSATIVALYILPTMTKRLIPKLDKLKPGSRVVSHVFAIPGVIPDKVVKVTSEEDDVERPIYLYTVPLRMEKK